MPYFCQSYARPGCRERREGVYFIPVMSTFNQTHYRLLVMLVDP